MHYRPFLCILNYLADKPERFQQNRLYGGNRRVSHPRFRFGRARYRGQRQANEKRWFHKFAAKRNSRDSTLSVLNINNYLTGLLYMFPYNSENSKMFINEALGTSHRRQRPSLTFVFFA